MLTVSKVTIYVCGYIHLAHNHLPSKIVMLGPALHYAGTAANSVCTLIVMAGLQKKAGKKALAAAAPPPKPSQNIIAPPAPARYKSSAVLIHISA